VAGRPQHNYFVWFANCSIYYLDISKIAIDEWILLGLVDMPAFFVQSEVNKNWRMYSLFQSMMTKLYLDM
jgi:hypothetical protein